MGLTKSFTIEVMGDRRGDCSYSCKNIDHACCTSVTLQYFSSAKYVQPPVLLFLEFSYKDTVTAIRSFPNLIIT